MATSMPCRPASSTAALPPSSSSPCLATLHAPSRRLTTPLYVSSAQNVVSERKGFMMSPAYDQIKCRLEVGVPRHGKRRSLRFAVAAAASVDVGGFSEGAGMAEVVGGVIVGAGRVGQALEKMGGGRDIVVRRGEKVPEDSTGPIFVCTRNDVLESVVDSTPPSRRKDLVFLQNGMIEPWLESKGLSEATQVLVYFAVAKLGDVPQDGKTDTNPEGLTAASGKWAAATAARLHSAGLSCKVLDVDEFQNPMLEKLIWIAAFMLVGARHPGATVGVVEKEHRNEVVDLIKELAAAASAEKHTKFGPGMEDRLCAYARSVAHFPTALKEFEWRNGWFYGISKRAVESGKEDPCPLHTAWLNEVGVIKS